MKKEDKIIGILWIFTILATFGLTYHLATSTKSNIKKDYVLKTQYDSIMRVVNADEEEIKDLRVGGFDNSLLVKATKLY
jgi:hypothetical protein